MAIKLQVPLELLRLFLQLLEVNTAHWKYFNAPILVGQSDWSDGLPDWIRVACIRERFCQILDEYRDGVITEQATPAEIVCLLQPLTLVAPLRSEYAQLCLWAFDQILVRHDRLPVGCHSFFESTGEEPIRFEGIQHVHQEVSRLIRRKVVRHAPKHDSINLDPSDRAKPAPFPAVEPAALAQLSLFL